MKGPASSLGGRGEWWVVVGCPARADGSPRAVAAAAVPAGGLVDPGAADGLARAMVRWWSGDGAGFDVTIAVEVDRLSAAASDGGR